MARDDQRAERLVGKLVSAGVNITTEGDNLVFHGPSHAMRDETIAALRAYKGTVLAILAHNHARGVVALAPTTREQQRMELRNRMDRNPATYNVCVRVNLHGPICPEQLERAVTALVHRHEALRTCFAWYGEYLLQEIMLPPRSTIQMLPPTLLTEATNDEVGKWCARRGAAPFNLATEVSARWCYVPLGQRRAILLVTMHHIICDGWSIDILANELNAFYRAEAGEAQVSLLPPVVMTLQDFARWELEWLTPERVDSTRSFWTEELRGVTLAPQLTRATGRRSAGGDADCVVRMIPPLAASGVATLARELAITKFSLYFAAFAMLLHEETDEQDCAVVIAVANRTQPEHEGVVGLCRNAVPIRCSVSEGDTIDVVAHRISTHVLRVIEHQTCPIGIIAPWSGDVQDEADIMRLPITFGFEPQDNLPMQCSHVLVEMEDVFLGAARAEFSLLVRRRSAGLEAFFEFSKDQLSLRDAGQMADRYVQIVASAGTLQGDGSEPGQDDGEGI